MELPAASITCCPLLRPCWALESNRGSGSGRPCRDEDPAVAVCNAETLIGRCDLVAVGTAPLIRPVVLGLDIAGEMQLPVLDGDEMHVEPLDGVEFGRRHRSGFDPFQGRECRRRCHLDRCALNSLPVLRRYRV